MADATDVPSDYVDYEQALRLIPKLIEDGRLELARRWSKTVVWSRPMDPRGWNQLALVDARRGNFVGAQHAMMVVTIVEPGSADLLVNHGNMVRMRGGHEGALALFRKALVARPGDSEIEVAVALQLLTLGEYEEGLALYERRWSRSKALEGLAEYGVPAWDGDAASVRSLVCVMEQGAGDAIQFIRYAEMLHRAGIEVTVYCTDPLVRLLETAKGVNRAVTRMRPNVVDAAEMMMSLPLRFGTRVDSLPSPGRYIDPPKHAYRIPAASGRLRVGVCWAGNPNHRRDLQRSCPYDAISTLFDVDGIDFYSLQVGDAAEHAANDPRIVDLSDKIDDFADTAGLVDQMDLVISVDSAVAHIAGALDRPCWVLLHSVADWRWGQSGETTGWYPNTRLERRGATEQWADIMPRLAANLAAWRERHAG